MSLLKSNSIQIGQSTTATNNFTLSVPSSPDGTIKLARGNSGATTADIFSVSGSGAITGATISGATINSSTVNGGSITLGTAQSTTSGTAIDFTGIPSWVKRITMSLAQVSTNGSSMYQIRLGTNSGIVSSGYDSVGTHSGYSQAGYASTTGILIPSGAPDNSTCGHVLITKHTGNAWVSSICAGIKNTANLYWSWNGGSFISLSDTLVSIRLTTVNGSDTFDAGSVNIMYEG